MDNPILQIAARPLPQKSAPQPPVAVPSRLAFALHAVPPRPLCRLPLTAWAWWCVALWLPHSGAFAQADPLASPIPPLALRPSQTLQEKIPPEVRSHLPVFVRGERMQGQAEVNAVVEGDAELRRGDTVIHADQLEYDVPQDVAHARGHVRMNRAGNRYEGTALDLQVNAFVGSFHEARYRFLATDGHGEATRVDFLSSTHSLVHHATYTTCQRTDEASWQPDWVVRAERIVLDTQADEGSAYNARLEFQGVALPRIPYLSFPLSDKRKSGLLPPTIIPVDSRSGPTLAQPYYWNIAPNRDATLTPTLMARRGASLGAEFRYLEPHYSGSLRTNWMPYDNEAQRQRWAYSLEHQASFSGLGGWGSLGAGLGFQAHLNRVSDNNYWRDFPRAGTQLTQRLLPSHLALNWAQGDATLSLRTLQWQTLQDPASPIIPPYNRLPQIAWRYTPQAPFGGGLGLETSLLLDSTRFEADALRTGQPNAQRSVALAQVSRPFSTSWGFFTPRLQLHSAHYTFDGALANGQRSASRTLPTVSLDSGLFFERDTQYLGRSFTQTLEPRAFYTYTPYRDQHLIPLYDTAANDFNFATVFTENAYTGNDRLADNNLLTLGLTSRLLDPATGGEMLRLGLAQRLRFADQRVTVPGVPVQDERVSDVLLGMGVNWTPHWGSDATVQYRPQERHSVRSTVSARYHPGAYRTLNAAYRFQRNTSEQLDVGWQWPLNLEPAQNQGRWYSVGRLNYSMMEKRVVDAVVGLEYDSCCWIGRVVLERLQSGYTTASTRLLLQVEFVGFTRLSLGSNPLSSLKNNIRDYQYLREQVSQPSRFSQYE